MLALAAIVALIACVPAMAQENNVPGELAVEGPVAPGGTATVAIAFSPEPGWHGYWSNPGDAGLGMVLDWSLPKGWQAGEPQYPVPTSKIVADLVNHVYEGPYAVLVDIEVPEGTAPGPQPIALTADYLACTDEICVPQTIELSATVQVGEGGAPAREARFDAWRAAIPPLLDSEGTYTLGDEVLRLSLPIPAALDIGTPHVFLETRDVVNYQADQTVMRDGDRLLVEIPVSQFGALAPEDRRIEGIVALGEDMGLRFAAASGEIGGTGFGQAELAPLWVLLMGALAGGLLLNIMPCVFPILSLKALSLAKAGESQRQARMDGLAYTAGVVLACIGLGALMLALRAAGEQVGWAFQLQQPGVIIVLLVLAVAITANFLGLFEIPGLSLNTGGKPTGAFATGLLAAFVATPCTGPFMAAALGAALLLPAEVALLLFAALGLGLALPFLLLGFVPALRRLLPRPGPWMETFRRWMALPMGLTALALVWLSWRIGGAGFAALALGLAVTVCLLFMLAQRRSLGAGPVLAGLAAVAVAGWFAVPPLLAQREAVAAQSLLEPRDFSRAALAEARATGQPVFVWFTADWCVTCKVNERVAIEREATAAAFEQAGVIAVRGDWTRQDAEIAGFLSDQGAAGVPLYLWYDAGGQARTLPQVLTPNSLLELAEGAGS